jgi:hypothetical protein
MQVLRVQRMRALPDFLDQGPWHSSNRNYLLQQKLLDLQWTTKHRLALGSNSIPQKKSSECYSSLAHFGNTPPKLVHKLHWKNTRYTKHQSCHSGNSRFLRAAENSNRTKKSYSIHRKRWLWGWYSRWIGKSSAHKTAPDSGLPAANPGHPGIP